MARKGDFTEILLRRRVISQDQLNEARQVSKDQNQSLAQVIVKLGYASGDDVMRAVAQEHGRDRLATLGARRTRLRLGDGWIELLEPDGTGIVDTALQRRGAHLFAAGAASPDLPALRAHLASQGVQPPEEAGQLHLSDADTGVPGFRVVLSAEAPQPVVGDIDFLSDGRIAALMTLVRDNMENGLHAIEVPSGTSTLTFPTTAGDLPSVSVLRGETADQVHLVHWSPTVSEDEDVYIPPPKICRYVGTQETSQIALVHETLSQSGDESVGFDQIVDRVASMAVEVSVAESKVTLRREGTFGVLPSEYATPLVMVVNELIQNAVERDFG